MARQPIQVHIWLYRPGENGTEYALFRRSDMPACYQGVCGGLEGDETPEQGARRETWEEAGITDSALPLYRLSCVSYLPDSIFSQKARARWGKDVVVVPMYFFAMPYTGEIRLSHEHTEVHWLPFEEAHALTRYDDQKIALYELNERLKRGNLIPTAR